MLNYSTLQTLIQIVRMVADIGILWILLFYTIKIVRNNTRTAQIFKGIILILVVRAIANYFGFKAVDWLAGVLVTYGFLAIIIIFQPEIRTILERLGKNTFFSRLSTLSGIERERLVEELVSSTMHLSTNRIGALITIEQGISLNDFIKTGTPINSLVNSELLNTIFLPNTPIHDGAVIIQGDRIACASAYFPPTNMIVPTRFGARHRAAIGISEITDSITIVVSEKSGRVSIAEEGKLVPVNQTELRTFLQQIILHGEEEVTAESTKTIFPTKPESNSSELKNVTTDSHRRSFFKGLFSSNPDVKSKIDIVETQDNESHEDKTAEEIAEAKLKAKAEAARLKKEAEEKALAEAKAKAEAEAARLRKEAEEKALAEAKAKAEAEAARLKKEAEEKALVEAKAKAEAEAARLKKEAEEKALAEAKAKAEAETARLQKEENAKALAEAQVKKIAEEKEKAEAKALARAEVKAKYSSLFTKLFNMKEAVIEEVKEEAKEEVVVAKPKKKAAPKKTSTTTSATTKKKSSTKAKPPKDVVTIVVEEEIEKIKNTPHVNLEYSVSDESLLDDDSFDDETKGDN